MSRIATVINFCSSDLRFLEACIEGACSFSHQILIPVCDHFFDGTPENYALLECAYKAHPDCTFIEFAYEPSALYYPFIPPISAERHRERHWHNTSRWLSFYFLEESVDAVLFLDVDEIVDGAAFERWLQKFDHQSYAALRFASYWYFRAAKYRATSWQDAGLLVKREALHTDLFFDPNERKGLYAQVEGEKLKGVVGLDGKPLMHHYSWVRTKQEMLQKTASWGHHRDEENWPRLVAEEFSREFNGKDFSGEFVYETVAPVFDPLAVSLPVTQTISLEQHLNNLSAFSHVQRVNRSDIFQKDLAHRFAL